MALRDRPFDRDTNLAVIRPLTHDALDRIRAQFVAWAVSEDSRPFRYRRRSSGRGWHRVRRRELADRARAAIQIVPHALDLVALERLVRSRDYPHFGVELFVTADAVALSFSHRFSDGLATGPSVRAIIGGELAPARPYRPFPLVRALAATGQLSVRGVLAGRAFHREQDWVLPLNRGIDPSRTATDETVSVAQVALESAELSRLVAAERAGLPEGERLAPSEVIAGLTLRALRACLVGEGDLPIIMTAGLRRFLPAGVDARGNLVAVTVVGTLRSSPWSSREVRDVALPRTRDPRLVPAEVVDLIAATRRRLRSLGRREPQPNHVALVLNLLHGSLGVRPEDVPVGGDLRLAMLLVHRGQSNGPHVTVGAARTHHIVTVLDDSGLLDLTRLESAFAAECRALGSR